MNIEERNGYVGASKGFKFKHRVVIKGPDYLYAGDNQDFVPSCYGPNKQFEYLPGESGYKEYRNFEKMRTSSKETDEAAEYLEAAALNWLLEGEE